MDNIEMFKTFVNLTYRIFLWEATLAWCFLIFIIAPTWPHINYNYHLDAIKSLKTANDYYEYYLGVTAWVDDV